jgi:two-component system chemotaxis response regulator CheY
MRPLYSTLSGQSPIAVRNSVGNTEDDVTEFTYMVPELLTKKYRLTVSEGSYLYWENHPTNKFMAVEVLIVDDSDFQRTIIRDAVEPEFEVVGEAATGVEAVEEYERLAPDATTMDVNMPEMDGVAATAEIKATDDPPSIIMVTSVDQTDKMKEAVKAGADGYVTKPFEEEEILAELDSVL